MALIARRKVAGSIVVGRRPLAISSAINLFLAKYLAIVSVAACRLRSSSIAEAIPNSTMLRRKGQSLSYRRLLPVRRLKLEVGGSYHPRRFELGIALHHRGGPWWGGGGAKRLE